MSKVSDFNKTDIKTIGVVGLGLIGGSFAKAFRRNTKARILGYDRNENVCKVATLDGTLDGILSKDNISECDLIIPALYNQAIIDFVKDNAPLIKKGAMVLDTGGLKRRVCKECFEIAREYGFHFVGGHPMAGKKFSGYNYSTSTLFVDAFMIIITDDLEDKELQNYVKDILSPCRFQNITVCSAEVHDKMIAFTSEMPHIISNAFIKSPTAREHLGFSAGSYKDMTRVAWLNEDMWTEIFLENRDNLIFELDELMGFLAEYKKALEEGDGKFLWEILHKGKIAKEEVDGI